MRYIADLHVHSHYSRATSKDLNLESLYQWAKIKGINVVGTGDFTHPGWVTEMREKLNPVGNGFFVLKDPPKEPAIPGIQTRDIDVRFCLTVEISSIYKHGDRVRKNHNLLFAPDFDTVTRINHKLASIGNVESDGRPILGLPSRDLLEIVLETSDRAHLIPAHVWTPWFSTFGSKAGYDSIDACFRDLTEHIFALETGLSSDPLMNGKLSDLDRFQLVSNSDAHSASKLGREANLLDTELTYDGMFDAFRTGEGLLGTYEFYPEEGKYHHDGHRKCGISMEPNETQKYNNICPECGKPLTVGVLHRVADLADREESEGRDNYEYQIPLPEVLGEIEDVSPNTKTVRKKFREVISSFGTEFELMREIPIEDIRRESGPVLAEAIRRIRENEVIKKAGFDGVFGEIKVFNEGEIDRIRGQLGFFGIDEHRVEKPAKATAPQSTYQSDDADKAEQSTGLNTQQEQVRQSLDGATLVKAGPGTGKTHTLVEWIAHQVESGNARPDEILAITFTNKAAGELEERLIQRIGEKAKRVTSGTFHALCWQWLRERNPQLNTVYDASARKMTLRILFPELERSDINSLNDELIEYLELGVPVARESREKIRKYREYCREQGAVDLSDLIRATVENLEEQSDWLGNMRNRYQAIAVDEFQDINPMQYRLISLLGRNRNLLAIGDPDQAIYGFRGSDVQLFFEFAENFSAREISLQQNYRSTDIILNAAGSLISHNELRSGVELRARKKTGARIRLYESKNPFEEADYILDEIAKYVGGTESLTSGEYTDSDYEYAFSDIAVLFRTHSVGEALFKSFLKSGIPVHYGDGTAFLAEPPFTVVANILRLSLKPDNHIVLRDLLEENYGWTSERIHSLISTLNTKDITIFGDNSLETIAQNSRDDLDDLRSVYQAIEQSLDSNRIAEAIEEICDHYLAESSLSESDFLKKETLIELAEESNGNVEDFLEQMQLNPYTDAGRLKTEGVHLLTFHAAKGLEFPVVFIAGAEEGVTPLDREDIDIEEERRLFYVAMTRAEDELQITCARERARFGEIQEKDPSRFIGEIPDDLLIRVTMEKSPGKKSVTSDDEQLGLF
ncbi:MAG: UvrD-helicase domain-containing protein [Candidatus Marinimicrobia bacterium]|nr:UvrD-helicase domain-containing protein [Candidatus Neomarinimicrobiota bacterium]MCF7829024.1 UvrD-helicase domain-containing protein [Candidatus Neomarinimicrobiota bacterium]MCF7881839.1 UvrD-helicase domain-containing protein [Candidatus Neomarinimicrobiota bacterium]